MTIHSGFLNPIPNHLLLQAAVRCVKYDGTIIVSGAYDHNIHIWNASDGMLMHILEGHTNRVYSIHVQDLTKKRFAGYTYSIELILVCKQTEFIDFWQSGYNNTGLECSDWRMLVGYQYSLVLKSIGFRQTLVGHQSLTSGMKLRDNILISANADSTIKVHNF